jgi:predicted phage terminase large subunit-like protein
MISEKRRFNVACLGRRAGKTVLGKILLVGPRGLLDGFPCAWFAPTYKLLDEVYRDMKRTLKPVIQRTDSTQKRIELVTGGVLDFWSMDNDDPARGRKYSVAILDEAAMVPRLEDVWNLAIRPTLIDFKGEAWFLSTPKGLNAFYDFHKRGREDDPDRQIEWMSWQAPTTINPSISTDEIEKARLSMPELEFQQEILARFVELGGAAMRREWLRYSEPPPGIRCVMGVDLAISMKEGADYTAAVVMMRSPEGITWIVDAARIRASFDQVLRFIQNMAGKWNPALILIEQVQYQAAVVQELLRQTTLPVKGVKPDRDKMTRFSPLQARYEQGLVHHSKQLPDEFERELLSFPIGAHDDYIDAAAYAFNGLGKLTQPSTGPRYWK